MRVLSTKVHGVIDYLMGIILIAAPWLLKFDREGAETWVPVVLGVGAILYSLFTDYELSVRRVIPMRTHLTLDILSGVFLALSPWLFGFHEYVYLPHLILGIIEVAAGLMTETAPKHAGYHTNVQN
jgi:SPW repeat